MGQTIRTVFEDSHVWGSLRSSRPRRGNHGTVRHPHGIATPRLLDTGWVNSLGRLVDLYVFAWLSEMRDGYADHRDTNQCLFFVVSEQDLPKNRKHIGLTGIKANVSPCRIADLKRTVENVCSLQVALKAMIEHV